MWWQDYSPVLRKKEICHLEATDFESTMDFLVSDSLLVFFKHTWAGARIKFLDLKSGRLFEAGRLLNFSIFSKCSMFILQQNKKW